MAAGLARRYLFSYADIFNFGRKPFARARHLQKKIETFLPFIFEKEQGTK